MEAMDHGQKSNFDQKLDLFKTGYCNAQDIIKFIDAKNGVVSGFATVAIGGTLALTMWIFENADACAKNVSNVLADDICVVVAAGLSVCFGAASLFCCLRSLIGRPPPEELYRILFPCFVPKMLSNAKQMYQHAAQSLTEDMILQEYWEQVAAVGQIIYKKLHWHRWSLIMCAAQFAAATESGILLILGLYIAQPIR
jgi:hypothetical protein